MLAHRRTLVVKMKVLVIGFSKTGTKSMHAALKKLGYKVYDYEHNFYYLRKQWIKVFSSEGGTKEDFYEMYKDVDATMDIPACVFWEEIVEAFPDTKLVFNENKTEDEWWASWYRTTEIIDNNKLMKAMAFLSPTAFLLFQYAHHVARVSVGNPPQRFYTAYRGASPTVAKMRYRIHNAKIREFRETASKDQFLTFHPSEGWGPLCEFLGKPVPDEDFPYKNKGGSVLDDLLKESPIFHQMKYEMSVLLAILVILVAVLLFRWLY